MTTKDEEAKARAIMKKKFSDPKYILDQMADYLKKGDLPSSGQLVAEYISYSDKYSDKESFAKAASVSLADLNRFISRDSKTSLKTFYNIAQKLFDDTII